MAQKDPIEEAWVGLQSQWDDPDAHRKFIGLCATLERLPEAGSRYRRVRDQDSDPERRAVAESQIDRLLGLALQSLEALRSQRPRTSTARRLLLLLALALALGMMALTGYSVLP